MLVLPRDVYAIAPHLATVRGERRIRRVAV
jgi:hypothetical protein